MNTSDQLAALSLTTRVRLNLGGNMADKTRGLAARHATVSRKLARAAKSLARPKIDLDALARELAVKAATR